MIYYTSPNESSWSLVSSDEADVVHIGVKRRSGRYPYGSGDRPHQHDGGGRLRIKVRKGPFAAIRTKVTEAKEKIKSKNKDEKPESEEQKLERKLSEIRVSPTASDLEQYVPYFSTEELNALMQRVNTIRNIQIAAQNERTVSSTSNKTFSTVDQVMNRVKTVQKWGQTAVDTYNTFSKIEQILKGSYKDDPNKQENKNKPKQ